MLPVIIKPSSSDKIICYLVLDLNVTCDLDLLIFKRWNGLKVAKRHERNVIIVDIDAIGIDGQRFAEPGRRTEVTLCRKFVENFPVCDDYF